MTDDKKRERSPSPAISIQNTEQLDDILSEPSPGIVETMQRAAGDIIILGVGGKMGPSLARMAKRASDQAGVRRRVIGVSRFSSTNLPDALHRHGIETISCDLLDPAQLQKLPDVPNVIYMAGMKFGSTGQEALTWAMNCHLPGLVSRKYHRSRIVAFSTGNIYGLIPVGGSGSVETDFPRPTGDYAMSCLGRERIFEHFSRTLSIPMAMIRLNYAVELRYGVLVDIARWVWDGTTIDVSMGHFNAVWQAEANGMSLQALDHAASPPFLLNVVGPEVLSIRGVAEDFGRLMNKPVRFTGTASSDAFLGNGQRGYRLMGAPKVTSKQMIPWIADWVMRGGETLNKPTHFEVRDGKY